MFFIKGETINKNIYFAILLGSILILIDLFTNMIFSNFYIYSSKFTYKEIAITYILSLLISFTTKKFRYIFSILFIFLSLIEVLYFSFFRSLIQPYHFRVLFSEIDDILDSIYSIFPHLHL